MHDKAPTEVRRTVLIRQLDPSEASRVGELTLAAYDRYGRIEGDYRTYLGDPLLRIAGSTAVLVAEVAGKIVGTVTFVVPADTEWEGEPEPSGDAMFRVLAVAPDAEGLGVGRALVSACIDLAREQGCHRLVIVSMGWMSRAHVLYERMGFVRRPDLDVRFPAGHGVMFQLDLSDQAPSRFPPPRQIPEQTPWFTDVWQR